MLCLCVVTFRHEKSAKTMYEEFTNVRTSRYLSSVVFLFLFLNSFRFEFVMSMYSNTKHETSAKPPDTQYAFGSLHTSIRGCNALLEEHSIKMHDDSFYIFFAHFLEPRLINYVPIS